ncbi:uncharacterized protein BKA78DRAFT_294209 [Phyllosticta capitalensis]|uniref:F-box domain-containing protein n=1 Tax=Phyllosticta capitalensis TaxID=121624 RepID=A0ABR1YRI9_9PEZI
MDSKVTEQGVFGELPAEVRLEIFEQLDYGSTLFLAATNCYYRSSLDPLSLSDEKKVAFLRQAEWFQQHHDTSGPDAGFACTECFKVKKRHHFHGAQITGCGRKVPPHLVSAEFDKNGYIPPTRQCVECSKKFDIFFHGLEARVVRPQDGSAAKWLCGKCSTSFKSSHWGCRSCGSCVHLFRDYPLSHSPRCPICKEWLLEGRVVSLFEESSHPSADWPCVVNFHSLVSIASRPSLGPSTDVYIRFGPGSDARALSLLGSTSRARVRKR